MERQGGSAWTTADTGPVIAVCAIRQLATATPWGWFTEGFEMLDLKERHNAFVRQTRIGYFQAVETRFLACRILQPKVSQKVLYNGGARNRL
jgi:hypothetical protein